MCFFIVFNVLQGCFSCACRNVSNRTEDRLNHPDRQLTTEFKDPTPELPAFTVSEPPAQVGHSNERPAPPSAVDAISGTDPTRGAERDANPMAKLLTFMRSRFQSDQPTQLRKPADMPSRPTPSLPPPPPPALLWSQSTSSSINTDSLFRAAQHSELGGKIPNPGTSRAVKMFNSTYKRSRKLSVRTVGRILHKSVGSLSS